MRNRIVAAAASLAVAVLGVAGTAHAGRDLDAVRARGMLNCGVGIGTAGFMLADSQGKWKGLSVDVCRAVAAALASLHFVLWGDAAVAAAEPTAAAPGAAPAPLPAPPVSGGGISIFELLPEAPLGIPLLAWVGGAIWLVIVALMFK